jgi:RimJ/RimL family protein N-acetyltransferase
MAENQRLGTAALAKAGLVLGVVDGENVSVADIAALLKAALLSPTLLAGMSARGMALVDGRGAIRLARRLTPPNLGFRHAGPDDCMSLFHWRNHPTVRANSLQHASLDESAHRAWFARVMADPNRRLLIVEDDRAVGVLRFDLDGSGTALVSAYLVPERIGSGLGQEVLRQGIAWLRRNQPSTHRLEAEILTHNRVSEEAFRQAGFREEKFMMVWTS